MSSFDSENQYLLLTVGSRSLAAQAGQNGRRRLLVLVGSLTILCNTYAKSTADDTLRPRTRTPAPVIDEVKFDAIAVSKADVGGQHSATVYLQVLPRATSMDSPHMPMKEELAEYENYLDTQAALLKSRFVLTAALKHPNVRELASVKSLDRDKDTAGWLSERLLVRVAPKNRGIIQVIVTVSDSEEAATLGELSFRVISAR